MEKLANEQLKCRKLEAEVKDEKTKRETIRRQMHAAKIQVGSPLRDESGGVEVSLPMSVSNDTVNC